VKKAEVIRDMVESISKIPNKIQQEIYVKECASTMDISEEVLFSTLAQILAKESSQTKKATPRKIFEGVKKTEETKPQVDPQFELERIIIGLLLRYGSVKEEFEYDLIDETAEDLDQTVSVKKELAVYEKIYLDLQEDEIEFANEIFRDLYSRIIDEFKTQQTLKIDTFINQISEKQAAEITSILMQNERNTLHRWEDKDIYVKDKSELEPREVNETIWNLRRFYIKKKVAELNESIKENRAEQNLEVIDEILLYKKLEVNLSHKLNRVI
ncbi:MAG TPA: DNA primase, partial [Flavobacteriaceae bacterium]|nr:DNA primase [Flavobacteriaceae bacterium]